MRMKEVLCFNSWGGNDDNAVACDGCVDWMFLADILGQGIAARQAYGIIGSANYALEHVCCGSWQSTSDVWSSQTTYL